MVSKARLVVLLFAKEIKLTNIKYVHSFKKNLISIEAIVDTKNIVVFSHSYCWIEDIKDCK